MHPLPASSFVITIQVRPFRSRYWQVFEAPGVQPFFGDKQHAVDYATQRMKSRVGEVQVFDADGAIEEILRFDKSRPV
ncbi:MAG: hypothetical protein QOE26_1361 [Verrucomicrobiota bacterium]|jgi:hypothetical protein